MFLKETLWYPSGQGSVQRILSCEEDGSILYAWKQKNTLDSSSHSGSFRPTYIRLFNPTTERDEILYVSHLSSEVISASLSVDRRAIAFTLWVDQESSDGKSAADASFVAKSPSGISGTIPEDVLNAMPLKVHKSSKDPAQPSFCNETKSYHKGLYRSFLAEVFPTGWSMKFNTDRRVIQRVTFSKYLQYKTNGDLRLTTYEVLLSLHKESIGLYSVILQESLCRSAQDTKENTFSSKKVYGRPTTEVIVDKAVWSQWDAVTQRLYYAVPLKKANRKKNNSKVVRFIDTEHTKFQFVCVQFYEAMPHKKVLEFQIDLGLSKHALHSKGDLVEHRELDPTVSSTELNMRVCLSFESGAMCLCWQERPIADIRPKRFYSVAILNKDIVIHYPASETEQSDVVNFLPLGPNLLVHSPGHFAHVYDIENMYCEMRAMRNGLHHILLSDKCFSSLFASSLQFVMHWKEERPSLVTTQLSILSDSVDSLPSSTGSSSFYSTVLCYDVIGRAFVTLHFDPHSLGDLFHNESLTMKHRFIWRVFTLGRDLFTYGKRFFVRICLTRMVVFSTTNRQSSDVLTKILEFIMQDPSSSDVTGVLAQLLLATAAQELGDHRSSVPTGILPLFPSSVPGSALARMFNKKATCEVEYDYLDVRKSLTRQIEQYVSSVTLQHKVVPGHRARSSSNREDSAVGSLRSRGVRQDVKDALWYRSLNACMSGNFTAYDLECIREELTIVSGALKHPGQLKDTPPTAQSAILLNRLATLYEKGFLKSSECSSSNTNLMGSDLDLFHGSVLSFLNENERDQNAENIIVLTSEKLSDHLNAHWIDESSLSVAKLDVAMLSRYYVHAQMHAVHHILTLMMLKSGVDDFETSLYVPASDDERTLLIATNQFQLVCSMICFPLPNGFQTFVTCLTFRCMLSQYAADDTGISEAQCKKGHDALFAKFFALVNDGLVQLTKDFVARMLEELGDKAAFSPIVREVMRRTRRLGDETPRPASLSGIDLWNDPIAKRYLAQTHLKILYEEVGGRNNQPKSPAVSPVRRRFSLIPAKTASSSQVQKEQTVASYLTGIAAGRSQRIDSLSTAERLIQNGDLLVRMRSTSLTEELNVTRVDEDSKPEEDEGAFPALQSFLEFVKEAENASVGRSPREGFVPGRNSVTGMPLPPDLCHS